MFDRQCTQQGVLDELVEQILEEMGIDEPPIDAIAIAERWRLEICLDRAQQTRGRLARTGCQQTIFVQPEPRAERRHWTIAHEIGEKLLSDPEIAARLGLVDSFDPERERWASEFAALLLIPSVWWEFDARICGYDLRQLKLRYSTASHELLAKRMLDLDPPTLVTIFDQGKVSRRWTNTRSTRPPLFELERSVQQEVHQSGECVRSDADGLSVQGWAIHEPGWKREILRAVYVGYEE